MPLDSKHPQYEDFVASWQKIRTACAGEEAVKAAGKVFLPFLSGQTGEEYESYKTRALFYNASARTVQGLTGAIFRKPPDIKFPEKGLPSLKTIGIARESIEDIAKDVVQEVTGVGRVGILLDAPEVEDAEPYLTTYQAESIINWLSRIGPNGEETVEVVLQEEVIRRSQEDPFENFKATLYRVLILGNPGEGVTESELAVGPVYFQELYQKVVSKDQRTGQDTETFVFLGRVIPRMKGGKILHQIPFWVVNSSKVGLKPEKSPMIDLVNVNLSHYRNSADLEHGRHFTALPTAWVAGFDPDTSLTIGASRAWVSDNTQARADFLEFSGAGLGHLQEGMVAKEKLMAILGARMLEEVPVGTEAAETVRLRQSGEASALASISLTCSSAITAALKAFAEWMSLPTAEISFDLNRDFQTAGLAPNVLQNLILAVQGGLVSWNTLFYNMKRGELVADNVTEEQELEFIRKGEASFIIKPEPKPAVKTDNRI